MRRAALERIGVQLPVLPAIVMGALPGGPDWAPRLATLGLDVVQSGAVVDTVETVVAAREAVPRLPLKARPGDPAALLAAGAPLLEMNAAAPSGAYSLGVDDSVAVGVRGDDPAVEDSNDVAARIIGAAEQTAPAALWAAASAGLDQLDPETVTAKLAALVEGTRQARLAIAKVQFEDDEFWNDERPRRR